MLTLSTFRIFSDVDANCNVQEHLQTLLLAHLVLMTDNVDNRAPSISLTLMATLMSSTRGQEATRLYRMELDDPDSGISLDRSNYPQNTDVVATIDDQALNVDPTGADEWWYLNTDGASAYLYPRLIMEDTTLLKAIRAWRVYCCQ